MIEKITDNIFKIANDSNIFLIKNNNHNILIDAGNAIYRDNIIKDLNKLIESKKITHILLTHLHYDHIGMLHLFKNAKIYCSKKEFESYNLNPFGTILNQDIVDKTKNIDLNIFKNNEFLNLKIINTPGHTKGSVCFYLEEKNILFSGDTKFKDKMYGRTDLPTSVPEKLNESIKKINRLDVKILCPGHDY